MLGGWKKADVTSAPVISAVKFALLTRYPNESIDYKVVDAKQQVVAGMKYEILVENKMAGKDCFMERYEVWDRFGAQSLAQADILTDACGTVTGLQHRN